MRDIIKMVLLLPLLLAAGAGQGQAATPGPEKVGILFIHIGTDEQYRFDWHVQFLANLFDFFEAGMFAGGPLEGRDCYTLIHYASTAKAAVCAVPEGTPIDVFCRVYEDAAAYPVHPLQEEGLLNFACACTNQIIPAYFILSAGHSTTDPTTQEDILGPVVTHPEGSGLGIADFLEIAGFGWMDYHYRLPGYRDVHRMQALKWWYGNDAPGYAPDSVELTNIKDRLAELMPQKQFAFRHGWESYMKNSDAYGRPALIPDSTETALQELINDEGVDRIIVFHSYAGFSNLTQYGHDWYDADNSGVSAIPGRTFRQCVEALGDGIGPNPLELPGYLLNKPWEKHAEHPFPLTQELAEDIDPAVQVDFAPAYGQFPEFGLAALDLLNYTIAKYGIPSTASLKVILGHHGYFGAYKNAQTCDVYNRQAAELYTRVSALIQDGFAWAGPFELVHAAGEYAEGEVPGADEPGWLKPLGDEPSIGEQIDVAINGTWVNALGELVDNGDDNYEYIIVVPYFFDTESQDTIYGKREPLGNHIPEDSYGRDMNDADGTPYDAGDLDFENFTVKLFDATGWPSIPRGTSGPVCKGSATHPTTVIVTGTYLSLGNSNARTNLTEAAVKAISAAIAVPATKQQARTARP